VKIYLEGVKSCCRSGQPQCKTKYVHYFTGFVGGIRKRICGKSN